MDLLTFGIALPELPTMLSRDALNGLERSFPVYQRIHEVREQRPLMRVGLLARLRDLELA